MKYLMSVLLATASLNVSAGLITFDEDGIVYGSVINTQYNPDVTISAINARKDFNIASVYDTSPTSPGADPDLEVPWEGSNFLDLSDDEFKDFNNVLILQENNAGCDDGVCDRPDDQGSPGASSITFAFSEVLESIGFDIVDIEDPDGYSVTFLDIEGDTIKTVNYSDFSGEPDFVDNSINRIAPISGEGATTIVFNLAGSGGLDNISYDFVETPEPSSLAIFGLALMGFGMRRKR